MKQLPRRILLTLFLLTLCLIFWGISFHTPYMQDDYWMNYILEQTPEGSPLFTTHPISSWQDFFHSWQIRREWINGRLADFMAILLIWMDESKVLFCFLNTAVFLVNVAVLSMLCFRRLTFLGISAISMGFILLIPNIDGTVFWLAGACNYFWGTAFLGAFLLCLAHLLNSGKGYSRLVFFIGIALGLGCGLLHEGLGIPLTGGLAAFWIMERLKGKKLPTAYLWLLAAVALGTCYPISSPALWKRFLGNPVIAGSKDGSFFISIATSAFYFLRYGWIAILAFILLFWKKKLCFLPLIGWTWLTFAGFSCIVGKYGSWGGGYYYSNLLSLILCLQSTAPWLQLQKRWLTGTLAVLTVLTFAYQYVQIKKINNIYQSILAEPKEGGVCIVDWPREKGKLPRILSYAVPNCKADYRFPYCGRFQKQDDFWVLFRESKIFEGSYSLFDSMNPDEAHLLPWKDAYVLRLPRDTRAASVSAYGSDQNGYAIYATGFPLYVHALNLLKNRKLGHYSEDWHEGFRYLILPSDIQQYKTIRISYIKDLPYNPFQQHPSIINQTIPLP